MTVVTRIALVLGALLLTGAAVATLMDVDGEHTTDCGRWYDQHFTDDELAEYEEDADEGGQLGYYAQQILNAASDCEAAQEDRRTLGLSLLAAGIIIPVAVVFIGRGTRKG